MNDEERIICPAGTLTPEARDRLRAHFEARYKGWPVPPMEFHPELDHVVESGPSLGKAWVITLCAWAAFMIIPTLIWIRGGGGC
jgi:hypothetical protein